MADVVERLDKINICMCDYLTRDSSSDCKTVDDAKDEITRLHAENAKLRAALEMTSGECKEAFAENAKLRAALEPFVKEALHWESCEDAEPLVEAFPGYEGELIVGDLRRARAALGGEQ